MNKLLSNMLSIMNLFPFLVTMLQTSTTSGGKGDMHIIRYCSFTGKQLLVENYSLPKCLKNEKKKKKQHFKGDIISTEKELYYTNNSTNLQQFAVDQFQTYGLVHSCY